ncbi:conserved hypothetical protein [Afipia sp. 1NLS2]|nr:conserved hypothetical protein [Afipia sp. 1NLS2]
MRQRLENHSELFITHNFISRFSQHEFDVAFQNVLSDDQAKSALSALLLIEGLPDRAQWETRLDPPQSSHWEILAKAVAVCFDHQSQKATDIRWIKLVYFIISGRVNFSSGQADLLESIRLYPDHGDMRMVRPFIRATEISLRMMEFKENDANSDLPDPHQESFWNEVYKKTRCIPRGHEGNPHIKEKKKIVELIRIADLINSHFHSTITHTGLDARHDSSFGLILYAIDLLIESASSYSHTSAIGRSTLRTIVECFITLSYLISKNDASLWLKHRDHGNGQTKLSLLKNLSADNVPRFVDLELLEALANEDQWMEFSDINLGSWSSKNLREMAIDSNMKDVYDSYYDLCSGYTHGHWSAIRNSTFTTCVNPLHRFHRIPAPINFGMRSIVDDGIILVNRMLDELEKIYPKFEYRIGTKLKTTTKRNRPKRPRKARASL